MNESNGLPYTGEAIANHAMGPASSPVVDPSVERSAVEDYEAKTLSQPAQSVIPTDIDAWWAQRDAMIAALIEREAELQVQLEETRRRLTVLGYTGPEALPPLPKKAARATTDDDEACIVKVRAALSVKPAQLSTIQKRSGIEDSRKVRRALQALGRNGEVKRSGRGGAFAALIPTQKK